jgi:hypothetical protein
MFQAVAYVGICGDVNRVTSAHGATKRVGVQDVGLDKLRVGLDTGQTTFLREPS